MNATITNGATKGDAKVSSGCSQCKKAVVCDLNKNFSEFVEKYYKPKERPIEPDNLVYICREGPLFELVVVEDLEAQVKEELKEAPREHIRLCPDCKTRLYILGGGFHCPQCEGELFDAAKEKLLKGDALPKEAKQ
jgi:hypothetical protein